MVFEVIPRSASAASKARNRAATLAALRSDEAWEGVSTETPEFDAALRRGAEALRTGHFHLAREVFANLIASGSQNIGVYLGMAYACRNLGDHAAKIRAIDALLVIEPSNLRALMMKADHLANAGQARAAASFYVAVTKIAATVEQLPAELVEDVRRANAMCAAYADQYATHLHTHLAANGFARGPHSERFAESVDILLGKARPYAEQPRFYLFPCLSQAQFHERSDFPWFAELERATDAIRAELLGVLKDPDAFAPYVQGDANRAYDTQAELLNDARWSAFYLWKNGELVEKNAARCPNTVAAMRHVPLAKVANRSPSVLFSLLRPGARIPPHHGLVNTRLICHLPLIVPPGCGFRVGNETREWVAGKAWAFNDTIEHEAWNNSSETRVILLFDVWRPELTEAERGWVSSLFAGIDAYTGTTPNWEI